MPSQSVQLPDLDFNSREPWGNDTSMIIPIEDDQILFHEAAAALGVQCYLKMAKLPFYIDQKHNAMFISPNGKLPVVKCGAYVVSELEGVVQLVQSKSAGLTDHLNASERADLRAYMSLCHNVLGNAMLYFSWIDDGIYNNITYPRFGSPYNFPLRMLLPWDIRRKVRKQLNSLNWGKRTEEEVYKEVDTCISALSERLGDSKYFFHDSYTELDALVFGYLYTMFTSHLPKSNQLCNIVRQASNLVHLCQRIESTYFNDGSGDFSSKL